MVGQEAVASEAGHTEPTLTGRAVGVPMVAGGTSYVGTGWAHPSQGLLANPAAVLWQALGAGLHCADHTLPRLGGAEGKECAGTLFKVSPLLKKQLPTRVPFSPKPQTEAIPPRRVTLRLSERGESLSQCACVRRASLVLIPWQMVTPQALSHSRSHFTVHVWAAVRTLLWLKLVVKSANAPKHEPHRQTHQLQGEN